MAEAARWYDRNRAGLGLEFLGAVDAAFARVVENPRAGSPVPSIEDKDIRRVFVRRFPYHVVYLQLPDGLHVLAIAHERRRPAYWTGRLTS